MGNLHKMRQCGLSMQLQVMTKMSLKLPSLAMMSGGVLDVELFLISRNTLGNGKTTTQNLKDKSQMVVAGMVVAKD